MAPRRPKGAGAFPKPVESPAPKPPNPDELYAALDLGTNSCRMLIAQPKGSQFHVVDSFSKSVQLGAGLERSGRLSRASMGRTVQAMRICGQKLRRHKVTRMRLVATEACRRAKNARDLVKFVRRETGLQLDIIEPEEEARLAVISCAPLVSTKTEQLLVVDIGGGSTELVIGSPEGPRLLESVSLGCVVHTQRFFPDGQVTRKRFRAARLAAQLELEYLERSYRDAGWDVAIGSSGTVRGIWRVLMARGWCDDVITRDGLERLVDLVVDTGSIDAIRFDGLREDRRPVFPGGLAALVGIFDSLGIESMRTSERALREGLIYDLCERNGGDAIRSESVLATARRYGVDEAHARDVADTARHALRQVASSWGLEARQHERLLEWAALLHEVGLTISHSGYHKHGEYILRNSDIQGFSQTEQTLVAALVRLHRGKLAKAAFERVPPAWIVPVRRLALLLRLAYLLNRSRKPGVVPAFRLSAKGDALSLCMPSGWLEHNPLTRADLEREAEHLKAAGHRLSVHEVEA